MLDIQEGSGLRCHLEQKERGWIDFLVIQGNMWMLQSLQGTSIGDIRHKYVCKQASLVSLLKGRLGYGDFASYISKEVFSIKEWLSRILPCHPKALPKLLIPVSMCPSNMQGNWEPELLAGQRNLCWRTGRQPKAQPFLLPWCTSTGLCLGALGQGALRGPQHVRLPG